MQSEVFCQEIKDGEIKCQMNIVFSIPLVPIDKILKEIDIDEILKFYEKEIGTKYFIDYMERYIEDLKG